MYFPHDLKKAYQEGCLLPFIGAGISMSVTWNVGATEHRGPSWGQLVDQAIAQMGFSDPALLRCRGTDQQILEYYKRKNSGQIAKLTNWLNRYMVPPDCALKSNTILSELSAFSECNLFYTTNYDDFLERSLALNGRKASVVAVEAEMAGRGRSCEVVKFHGDWNHPDEIVLTERDYEQRLRLSRPLDLRLQADLLGRVVLFLGYSFRDPNVAYLFSLFNERRGNTGSRTGTRAYIVVSDPSDFERSLFAARGIEVIPIQGADRTRAIADLLAHIRN